MTLRSRILLLCFSTLLGIVLIASFSLYSLRQTMMAERVEQLTVLVELANASVEKAYTLEQSGKLTREQAQQQAKLAIGSFVKDEMYYFVRDFSTDLLYVHPNASRIGVPQKNMQQSGDRYRAALANSRIGLVQADGTRPGVKDPVAKMYAVVKFAPWDWLIGTGTYIDDINHEFWAQAGVLLAIGGALMLVVGALAALMLRRILAQLGGEPDYCSGHRGADCPGRSDHADRYAPRRHVEFADGNQGYARQPRASGEPGAQRCRSHFHGVGRDRFRQPRPVGAHGAAGGLAGRNSLDHGRDDLDRAAECGQCAPGEPVGHFRLSSGDPGGRRGEPGGRHHGRHQCLVEKDR